MWIGRGDLDTPFSMLIIDATNPETPREFKRNSESEFGMKHADLDNMSESQINKHIEFLDYLWTK